jgi:hypothetical protein
MRCVSRRNSTFGVFALEVEEPTRKRREALSTVKVAPLRDRGQQMTGHRNDRGASLNEPDPIFDPFHAMQ